MKMHNHDRIITITPAPPGLVVRNVRHGEQWDDPVVALALRDTWTCAYGDCPGDQCESIHQDHYQDIIPITLELDGSGYITAWAPGNSTTVGFIGSEELEQATRYLQERTKPNQ